MSYPNFNKERDLHDEPRRRQKRNRKKEYKRPSPGKRDGRVEIEPEELHELMKDIT